MSQNIKDCHASVSSSEITKFFDNLTIASSSLSETVIVSSELSYTPIYKRQRNEESFYGGPVKTYPLRQKKPIILVNNNP